MMTEIKRYCDICHMEIPYQKEVWYEMDVTFHTFSPNNRMMEFCGDCGNALMVHIHRMQEDFKNE